MILSISILCLTRMVRADWIDGDTPFEARSTRSYVKEFANKEFDLVMSDEFNVPGRKFTDGSDPMWTALDKNDYTNAALHYYDSDYAYTDDEGYLVIESEAKDTDIIGFDDVKGKNTHVTKHFKSAMLQTWNKFCFTGGIIEIEAILPGKFNVGGLWPAFWLLGNLSRHTYVGSSDGIWPWSLTECTETAKQFVMAQAISPCHNVSHFDMPAGVGRGSPEIDIFEIQPGNTPGGHGPFLRTWIGQPFMSTSYQIAPGKWYDRPGPGYWPGPTQWYHNIEEGKNTSINIGYYGNYNYFLGEVGHERDYWSDAISWNHQLEASHFAQKFRYRLEWGLPKDKDSRDPMSTSGYDDGYLNWYLNDQLVLSIKSDSIYNVTTGSVSSEPMYILLNTAISSNWGFPTECPLGCPCEHYDCNSIRADHLCGFPEGFCNMMREENPKYKINYIRVYQNKNDEKQKVGCSTPERPTRAYIEAHKALYKTENDKEPLKPIQVGRGACNSTVTTALVGPDTCGGILRGVCNNIKQKCECFPGWTGPHCLTREGDDSVIWDPDPILSDVGYYGPLTSSVFFISIGFSLVLGSFVSLGRRYKYLEGWRPIPDEVK